MMTSSEIRTVARNTWRGRYRPDGCVGTGKKGAMPEPGQERLGLIAQERAQYVAAYLDPDTASISPCRLTDAVRPWMERIVVRGQVAAPAREIGSKWQGKPMVKRADVAFALPV